MPRLNLIIIGHDAQPYQLPVERKLTTIGRGADNDIIINSNSASSQHCAMKRVPGGFILEDLGSTNGLKIGESLYSVIDLVDGMTINIGADAALEIEISEEEQAEFEKETFQSHQQITAPKTQPLQQEAPKLTPPKVPTRVIPQYQAKKSEPSVLLFLLLVIVALLGGIGFRHYQNISAPAEAPVEETKAAK